jgi:hypothetical protein
MIQPKSARLAEIFRRLGEAPAAASADEAYRLLCETIDAVEDELSGTPNDPAAFRTDGRIYPPQEDHRKAVLGRPDLRRYVSRGHGTLIGENGAITILDRDRAIVFAKPGADGRGT